MEHKKLLVAGEVLVNSKAFENLTILCDKFGSRFFATPEEKAGAEFLALKMREYGLSNARVEPYTHYGYKGGKLTSLWKWKRETALLELLEPNRQRLPCLSLAFAPSTPDDGITTELFRLENGSRTYLLDQKNKIKGKLVLDGTYLESGAYSGPSDPTNLYRPTVYAYLEQFGAAGMIYTRNNSDLPTTGGVGGGLMGKLPAVGIAKEPAQYLVRQLSIGRGVAHLKVINQYTPNAVSHNVVAELPGSVYPDQVILVGGHYDGHDVAVGAMDDAAGACVILEAARALVKHAGPMKKTIRFVCFSGEEVGLQGSYGYVLNHKDELKNINLMINTDSAGISSQGGHGFIVVGPDTLVPYLEALSQNLGSFDRIAEFPRVVRSRRGTEPSSDHFPFFLSGVPTARFTDIPLPRRALVYSHTTADTVDKVDPKGLKDAAMLLALGLMELANDDHFSIKHTPIDEIKASLAKTAIAENLRIGGVWNRLK